MTPHLPFPRYLAIALAGTAAAGCVYVALFLFQLGAPLPAEYWIRDSIRVKEYLAEQAAGEPRIFIMAGSGSLFGIDSGVIQAETGRRTINLATHGGLRFDFLAKRARRIVAPGDVILAPLEPNLIQLPDDTQWFFNNVMTWGRWYFDSLGPLQKLRFIFSVEPTRVLAGVVTTCLQDRLPEQIRRPRTLRREQIIRDIELVWAAPPPTADYAYPFKNLDRNGDLRVQQSFHQRFKIYYDGYLAGSSVVQPDFARLFTEFCRDMDEAGVRVVLLWPATMRDSHFDLSRQADRDTVTAFRDTLGSYGIRVIGSPLDVHYPRDLFLDSNFHLNARGREINTRRLVRLLRREVPELFLPTSAHERPTGRRS